MYVNRVMSIYDLQERVYSTYSIYMQVCINVEKYIKYIFIIYLFAIFFIINNATSVFIICRQSFN